MNHMCTGVPTKLVGIVVTTRKAPKMAIQDHRLKAKKRKWRTKPLTDTDVKTLPDGTYRDVRAPNLFLRVRGNSRSWPFRYTFNGEQKVISLGTVDDGVNRERAEEKARECNRLIGENIDPSEKRNNEQVDLEIAAGLATKMREATIYYMNVKIEPSTSEASKKNARRYCKQIIKTIGDVPVNRVTTDMILNRFNLIERYYAREGGSQVPNGERLRHYLQAIFRLHMHRCKLTHNPAGWDAMEPHIGKYVKKHNEDGIESKPGVHLEDMGRFFHDLQNYQSSHNRRNGALCLALIYLTGSRPGEARQAQWGEIVGNDWIVPKHHLKKRRKARAQPITEPMHAVFDEMRQRYRNLHDGRDPSPDDLIFRTREAAGCSPPKISPM
jgi:integrase